MRLAATTPQSFWSHMTLHPTPSTEHLAIVNYENENNILPSSNTTIEIDCPPVVLSTNNDARGYQKRRSRHNLGKTSDAILEEHMPTPGDPKYRRLRCPNRIFQKDVYHTGAQGVLLAAPGTGFRGV